MKTIAGTQLIKIKKRISAAKKAGDPKATGEPLGFMSCDQMSGDCASQPAPAKSSASHLEKVLCELPIHLSLAQSLRHTEQG